jgi:mannosyltransferase
VDTLQAAGQQAGSHDRRLTGLPLLRAVPPLVTMAVMLTGITGPSYIPDESATLSAVHRSFPGLLRTLLNIDAVHGAYYAMMWVITRLAGTGELTTRLPSALAMAAASAGVVALGWRLVSPAAGIAGGLALAVLPVVSYFGHEARPYGLMTALATLASYLLIRALEASPGPRRRWLTWYGLSLVALGLTQIFGLLVIMAHAVTVAWHLRQDDAERERGGLVTGWLLAAAAGPFFSVPVLLLAWRQRGTALSEIGYQPVLTSLDELFASGWLALVAGVVVAAAITVSALSGKLRERWPPRLIALSVPWLAFPPAVLLAASALFAPIYTARYVVFCLPAMALIMGAALAALGRVAGVAALAVLLLAALPVQAQYRTPTGLGRNIREMDRIIAQWHRPGDAVVFGDWRNQYQRFAYPYGLASLRDIALAQTPAQANNLTGTKVAPKILRARLATVPRVWFIGYTHDNRPSAMLRRAGFVRVRSWHFTPLIWFQLYARRGAGPRT